jgi:hypothetical protein
MLCLQLVHPAPGFLGEQTEAIPDAEPVAGNPGLELDPDEAGFGKILGQI